MGHQNIACSSSQVKIELNKPSSLRTHRGAEFLIMQLLFSVSSFSHSKVFTERDETGTSCDARIYSSHFAGLGKG